MRALRLNCIFRACTRRPSGPKSRLRSAGESSTPFNSAVPRRPGPAPYSEIAGYYYRWDSSLWSPALAHPAGSRKDNAPVPSWRRDSRAFMARPGTASCGSRHLRKYVRPVTQNDGWKYHLIALDCQENHHGAGPGHPSRGRRAFDPATTARVIEVERAPVCLHGCG